MALPGLIDTLRTVASLKVPANIVYDVATKAQKNFLSITSLTGTLALHLLIFSVRRNLYGGKR